MQKDAKRLQRRRSAIGNQPTPEGRGPKHSPLKRTGREIKIPSVEKKFEGSVLCHRGKSSAGTSGRTRTQQEDWFISNFH